MIPHTLQPSAPIYNLDGSNMSYGGCAGGGGGGGGENNAAFEIDHSRQSQALCFSGQRRVDPSSAALTSLLPRHFTAILLHTKPQSRRHL
jgi:hypothetical protein